MKAKILILLVFFALATLPAEAGKWNNDKQQRKNTVKKTNKRNKRGLKKWGLAQVVTWEEVQHAS